MKTKIIYLAMLFALTVPALTARAHEGHNEAFTQQGTASTAKTVVVAPEGQAAIGIKTQTVQSGSIENAIRATGRVEPAENSAYDINPPASGVVRQVYVQQGDTVAVGSLLATLHSVEMANTLTQLLQDRARMQGEISRLRTKAKGDLDRTRTQFNRDIAVQQKEVAITKMNYEREDQLLKEGVTARKDFYDAKNAYETAQVKLTALKNQLAQEVKALNQQLAAEVSSLQTQMNLSTDAVRKQLAVMGLSSVAFNRAVATNQIVAEIPLTSPVAGVVTFRDITPGEVVDTTKKIFSIVGLGQVWVVIDVFQDQVSRLQVGQQVRITTADNHQITGAISVIGAVVDPARRIVPVRVVVANTYGLLRPGTFVTADIVTAKGGSAVVVPASAVIEEGGRPIVFVQNGNNFQPVHVTLGSRSFDQVEIKSGLFSGDRIVITGARQLYSQSLLNAQAAPAATGTHTETTTAAAPGAAGGSLLPGILIGILVASLLCLLIWLFMRKRIKLIRVK
jgi:cobalt-zinc-cadmium efflux system membrane fusion protein